MHIHTTRALRAPGVADRIEAGLRAIAIGMTACLAAACTHLGGERLAPLERWHGWEVLGGQTDGGAECLSTRSDRIDCFTSTTSGLIVRTNWDGQRWNTSPMPGVTKYYLDSRPECASGAAGHIDCFARSGNDPTPLFQRVIDGSFMSGWYLLGGALASDPDCVAVTPQRIDCLAAGPNRELVHASFDGNVWSGWASRGGRLMQISKPSCVVFRAEINCIFASEPSNSLRHFRFTSTGVEQRDMSGGQLQLPGVASLGPKCHVSLDPDPNSDHDDLIHCFAPRVAGSAAVLARWSWDGRGNWSLSDLGTNFSFGDWDCVVRGSSRIDCVELLMPPTPPSGASPSGATGIRLRHRLFQTGKGVMIEDVTLPNHGAMVPSHIRCIRAITDRLDCFASGNGTPLLHAWLMVDQPEYLMPSRSVNSLFGGP